MLPIFSTAILFVIAAFPLGSVAGPVKVWAFSWTFLWLFDALFGGAFVSDTLIDLYILLSNMAFVLGAGFLMPKSHSDMNRDGGHTTVPRRQDFIFCQSSVRMANLGVSVGCWAMLEVGARQATGGGLTRLFVLGPHAALQLLNDNYVTNVARSDVQFAGVQAASIMVFFLAIFTGFRLAAGSGRHWTTRVALANFVAGLVVLTIISGTRSTVVVGLLFSFFSYVSYATYLSGGSLKFSSRQIVTTIVIVALFVAFVVIAQSIRLGNGQFVGLGRTLEYMRPWFAGYIPAATAYYTGYFQGDLDWGQNLARAILRQFGLVHSSTDTSGLSAAIGDYRLSNAPTIFWTIWRDFGLLGGVVFCLSWGFVSQYFYRRCVRNGGEWVVINALNLCAVMFSINSWYYGYGSRIFAGLAAIIVVALARHRFVWGRLPSGGAFARLGPVSLRSPNRR